MTDETTPTDQPAPPAGSARPGTRAGGARRPATSRAAGSTRFSAAPPPSFLEKYRRALLGGLVAVALVVVGGLIAFNAVQPAYACGQEWLPAATPQATSQATMAPGASPGRIGYVQPDLGRGHVEVGQRVSYALCPPASGRHYNQTNQGPVKPGFYAMDDETPIPQGFVHNLEHGGLVVLYRCPGDACTEAGQAALQALLTQIPPSPICGFTPTQVGAGTTIARFDQMGYPFAALLWGQIVPLQTLDVDLIKQFFLNQAERTNPEPACARPTATPSPTREASPSPAASGSAAPAASGSVGPAASGSAAPSAAPTAAPSAGASAGPSAAASPQPS